MTAPTENSPRTPLRVVQFTNTLKRSDGGPAKNSFELHRSLNSRDDTVATMIVMDRHLVKGSSLRVDSDALGDLRGGAIMSEISPLRATRLVASADAIIIHGYYLWWAPIVAVAARLLNARVYLTPHGALTEYQQRSSQVQKAVFDGTVGAILRRSLSSFVLGSEREAVDVRAKFRGVSATVTGVGTREPDSFNGQVETSPSPLAGSPLRILSLSRIAPKKRIDLAIEALKVLSERGTKAELIVAGTGEPTLQASLERQAEEADLGGSVRFVGEVSGPAKSALFSSADLFIAPSDDENFGISVAEALRHGLATVASKHVASAEGLAQPAGIVLDDRAPSKIADAIETLAGWPSDQRQRAAREFAELQYSWPHVAGRWRKAISV